MQVSQEWQHQTQVGPATSANTLMLTVLSCSKKCKLATCHLEEEIINNNSYCFLNSSLSQALS